MMPSLSWLSDPEVFCVNRLSPHSDHEWFDSAQSMREKDKTLFQPLDGGWLFKHSPCPDLRPNEFYKESFNLNGFCQIEVPGHIELSGYGQLQYINTMYPWDGRSALRPPQVDMSDNPVGSYVRLFNLNPQLLNKRVCISFAGVEQAFYVWLNGNFIGYGEDSFTPSDFDLTPYIREKDNRLCVEVYKRNSAGWLEDQDFFRFSGIFRSVYLYAKPETHIEDMWLMAGLANDYKTGTLKARLKVSGEAGFCVKCNILDPLGNEIYSEKLSLLKDENGFYQSPEIFFDKICAWSNTRPCLYSAELYLYNEQGCLCEIVPYKIGFRRFEMKDGIMLLNGERILFNGVNRHEWSALRGRSITADDMHSDMNAIIKNNINAVRTCHYPNQTLWYHLCDENGIYLIDETNLESHGSWQKMGAVEPSWNVPGSLHQWKNCVLDRAQSMFERDKNHASVLIWSCGNESYAGECIMEMSRFFRENDKSRLVHYEGVFHNREFDGISDIESRMYAKPHEIREYLSSKPKKPFILCEYMHDMGNSLGGMESYISLAQEFMQYQGGFIWDFKDQALWYTDLFGRRVLGYGGDFGERPTDYAFSANGILFADGSEKPAAQEVRYWYSEKALRNRQNEENKRRLQQAMLLTAKQKQIAADSAADTPLKIVEGDVNLGVYAKNFSVLFSYTEGGPVSLICGTSEWLHRAPRPAFWRAATENDKGNGFSAKSAVWLAADSLAKCIKYEVIEKSADMVSIEYTFALPTHPAAAAQLIYNVSRSQINVRAKYFGQKELPELPVFGIRFESFERIDCAEYDGLSGETYPDRIKGGIFGHYTYNVSPPEYLVPQEYGCHMDTASVRLCKKSSNKQTASSIILQADEKPFAFSVLPYTPMQLEAAQHREELPLVCRTAVSVFGAVRGVGGIDSWGAEVEEPYRISAEENIEFSFNILA